MSIKTAIESGEKAEFYSPKEAPFSIHGLYNQPFEKEYKRLPDGVASNTSDGVKNLYRHTAGGRIRFATDSSFVSIRVKLLGFSWLFHMTPLCANGFDIYSRNEIGTEVYCGSFGMNSANKEYESTKKFGCKQLREYTVNMPIFTGVEEVLIGVEEGAVISAHSDYKLKKPVVYYGSSITHGACASRPGMAYEAIISRKLDCDYINLGFSGACKAEEAIGDYIASLDMNVFVYDYDHNAPSVEYLAQTHEKLFEKVRKAQPNLPVIFVSRPNFNYNNTGDAERRNVIFTAYSHALAKGDKNVYFVDGAQLFGTDMREDCTVDGCHPTDLGFYRMACVIGKAVEAALLHR